MIAAAVLVELCLITDGHKPWPRWNITVGHKYLLHLYKSAVRMFCTEGFIVAFFGLKHV